MQNTNFNFIAKIRLFLQKLYKYFFKTILFAWFVFVITVGYFSYKKYNENPAFFNIWLKKEIVSYFKEYQNTNLNIKKLDLKIEERIIVLNIENISDNKDLFIENIYSEIDIRKAFTSFTTNIYFSIKNVDIQLKNDQNIKKNPNKISKNKENIFNNILNSNYKNYFLKKVFLEINSKNIKIKSYKNKYFSEINIAEAKLKKLKNSITLNYNSKIKSEFINNRDKKYIDVNLNLIVSNLNKSIKNINFKTKIDKINSLNSKLTLEKSKLNGKLSLENKFPYLIKAHHTLEPIILNKSQLEVSFKNFDIFKNKGKLNYKSNINNAILEGSYIYKNDTIKINNKLININIGKFLKFKKHKRINPFQIKGVASGNISFIINPKNTIKNNISDLKSNFDIYNSSLHINNDWPKISTPHIKMNYENDNLLIKSDNLTAITKTNNLITSNDFLFEVKDFQSEKKQLRTHSYLIGNGRAIWDILNYNIIKNKNVIQILNNLKVKEVDGYLLLEANIQNNETNFSNIFFSGIGKTVEANLKNLNLGTFYSDSLVINVSNNGLTLTGNLSQEFITAETTIKVNFDNALTTVISNGKVHKNYIKEFTKHELITFDNFLPFNLIIKESSSFSDWYINLNTLNYKLTSPFIKRWKKEIDKDYKIKYKFKRKNNETSSNLKITEKNYSDKVDISITEDSKNKTLIKINKFTIDEMFLSGTISSNKNIIDGNINGNNIHAENIRYFIKKIIFSKENENYKKNQYNINLDFNNIKDDFDNHIYNLKSNTVINNSKLKKHYTELNYSTNSSKKILSKIEFLNNNLRIKSNDFGKFYSTIMGEGGFYGGHLFLKNDPYLKENIQLLIDDLKVLEIGFNTKLIQILSIRKLTSDNLKIKNIKASGTYKDKILRMDKLIGYGDNITFTSKGIYNNNNKFIFEGSIIPNNDINNIINKIPIINNLLLGIKKDGLISFKYTIKNSNTEKYDFSISKTSVLPGILREIGELLTFEKSIEKKQQELLNQ